MTSAAMTAPAAPIPINAAGLRYHGTGSGASGAGGSEYSP